MSEYWFGWLVGASGVTAGNILYAWLRDRYGNDG